MLFMFVFSMVSSCKVIHFIFLWSMVILRTTDGGNVTWYEPPPVETASDPGIELTAHSRQFLQGSTHVQLSWNFSLTPDLSLSSVILRLNSVQVAAVVLLSGIAGLSSGFEGRFNFTWISQRATLIIFNVTEEDDGEFTCDLTTFQGVDQKLWKRKMKVEVLVETSLTNYSGDQTVNEGSSPTLFCDATGKPTPNVTWTRVLKNGTDGDVVFFGNPWVIVNISRTATGTHRCTAYNGIGNPVSHSLYINVTYQPDMVTLVTNTTENKDCSDLWVNFTCISSEANPPVYNYLLSDGEDGFNLRKSGTWITKISREGKSIFNCVAYQPTKNVTSKNNVTLTVNVPVSINLPKKNFIFEEGGNVEVHCNAAGSPRPTVIWRKVQGGGYNPTEGKLLIITNISRAQAGEYRCTANNTCGEKSTVTTIDVQLLVRYMFLFVRRKPRS
ncbi:neural cell adhesion molecule 2-like [Orbicella faveolata]|uniref:neural cell adhesion molecule 2-like n=1 Tax=Orbicella faveolata TaxID=48498 RepID=UPI0009E25043|nr:neural cell adhesion molecule 2-like [Orbicella faveolata]